MKSLNITLILILLLAPLVANADGENDSSAPTAPSAVATPGSDASFDKRLPPVYPGERVSDNGKEIKVWSTAGPVPVSPAPEPFEHKIDDRDLSNLVGGVVVDQRDRKIDR